MRKISTSPSPLETQITFNEKALHERFFTALYMGYLNSAQNIYQRMRCIIALSNQIALILKCVDSVNSKRSFKSVKLLYYRYLYNNISYPRVLFRIKKFNDLYSSFIE